MHGWALMQRLEASKTSPESGCSSAFDTSRALGTGNGLRINVESVLASLETGNSFL